ncbi:MAG: peptidylprolyl isomerase [Candidatus Brocadiales bacterium]
MKLFHNRRALQKSLKVAWQLAATITCEQARTLHQNDSPKADAGLFRGLNRCSILLPLLLIAATTWLAQPTLNAERRHVGTIVAVVNDAIITEEDVQRRAAGAVADAFKKYKGQELRSRVNQILEEVLNELVDRQLMVQKAHTLIDENPYVLEDIEKDLDSFLKDAVEEVGSLSKFYEIALKEGINPTEKKTELRDDLMVERLLNEFVYNKINISPKDIREYYQAHRNEFAQERSVKIRQLILKFSSYPSKKEARKKAEEIRDRAIKGENFEALAKEFSEGPRASEGSLWDFDEVLSMKGIIRKAALGLEKGQVSDIIQTATGLHILKAEDVRPASEPDFETLQEQIKDILFKQEAAKKKRAYVRELKKSAVIKVVQLR